MLPPMPICRATDISQLAPVSLFPLAQEKALGSSPRMGPKQTAYVGFSSSTAWNFSTNNQAGAGEYDFIGDALHELTHALGRDSGLNPGWPLTVMDLFQYASAGDLQTHTGGASYFSINGGVTNLGDFVTERSQRLVLHRAQRCVRRLLLPLEPPTRCRDRHHLDERAGLRRQQLDAPATGGATSVTVATDDSASEVGIGHVVTVTSERLRDGDRDGNADPAAERRTRSRPMWADRGQTRCDFAYTVQPATTRQSSGDRVNLPAGRRFRRERQRLLDRGDRRTRRSGRHARQQSAVERGSSRLSAVSGDL